MAKSRFHFFPLCLVHIVFNRVDVFGINKRGQFRSCQRHLRAAFLRAVCSLEHRIGAAIENVNRHDIAARLDGCAAINR